MCASRIPLNDDRQEKAVRLQSRQALHEVQLNTLKAAASPMRRLNNYNRAASDSPKTPRGQSSRGKENAEDGGLPLVAAAAMTPMKRMPILANFEEWMKMATDNKINAANSWNFALIDYFHDMSLLKEGDTVNFQKASCTLDGCVKIYTSRVDSVATETGKLLSGLADNNNKKSKRDDVEDGAEDGAEDGQDEEGEDGSRRKAKKKVRGIQRLESLTNMDQTQRSSENTLAPSFASLQLKKMELEFSVDPLFKKASADFDEGGAKGLLLNHLTIDANGRIVFDSSDDVEDATAEIGKAESNEDEGAPGGGAIDSAAETDQSHTDIDIKSLGARFFPNLTLLDGQDICPSLKDLDLGEGSGSLDIPFRKAPEEWKTANSNSQPGGLGDQTGVFLDGDNVAGFEEDDEIFGGFDVAADAAFGEGGDAWVKGAAIEPELGVQDSQLNEGAGEGQVDGSDVGAFDPQGNQHMPRLQYGMSDDGHDNILSYFDNALQKNWAGPEHWRIRRIKDTAASQVSAVPKKKEKEPFAIDFHAPLDPSIAEMIYTPASSNAAISLTKAQWKSKTRNLLPDDKHFNSKQLLRLFLKPNARMGSKRLGRGSARLPTHKEIPEGERDEVFWAQRGNNANESGETPAGDYDANFFQDDAIGFPDGPLDEGDDFVDAPESLPPAGANEASSSGGAEGEITAKGDHEGGFGSQLVTQSRRLRPEYMQYARVAKKVDVRRLKEEMWRGIGLDNVGAHSTHQIMRRMLTNTDTLRESRTIQGNAG